MPNWTATQVLRLYVGEQDQWHGRPLYAAVVTRLREADIAGVTVLHGIEGYGGHRAIHTQRIEVLFQGLPVVIEAVDTPDHIERALSALDQMGFEGLVTVHDAVSIRYEKGPAG